MNLNENRTLRIAILDLYEGVENQGMRGLRQTINDFGKQTGHNIFLREFDVRLKNEFPDTGFDIYISSGGPGSPISTVNEQWDINYMNWIRMMDEYNLNPNNTQKKYVYFICHSFQLVSRYFKVGRLAERKSTAFGVFPIHLLEDGQNESVFYDMKDPFYAVDSRDYQLIEPDIEKINNLGAKILCLEKERPHVPYERAIMGIRFTPYFIGTQFHPEADALGMWMYLQKEDKKTQVIANYGEEKWSSMVTQLEDPDKIRWTYSHILPNFLNIAVNSLYEVNAVSA